MRRSGWMWRSRVTAGGAECGLCLEKWRTGAVYHRVGWGRFVSRARLVIIGCGSVLSLRKAGDLHGNTEPDSGQKDNWMGR